MQGDDAPPALPVELQGLFGAAARPRWTHAAASTALVQPPSMRVAARSTSPNPSGIMPASAEMPLGISLINPASALSVDPGASGLQQAIYFEASDQAGAAGVELPPIAPAR
jgi:hypothetical protein